MQSKLVPKRRTLQVRLTNQAYVLTRHAATRNSLSLSDYVRSLITEALKLK
jgi:uncharacterized protein (DUF1778 family)